MSWINNSIRSPEHLAALALYICACATSFQGIIYIYYFYIRPCAPRACLYWVLKVLLHIALPPCWSNAQPAKVISGCDPLFIYSFEIITISRCHCGSPRWRLIENGLGYVCKSRYLFMNYFNCKIIQILNGLFHGCVNNYIYFAAQIVRKHSNLRIILVYKK